MTTYRLVPGVLRADLKGKEVLLNPETGQYHLLNATGARLLALFEGGLSFDDSVSRLASEAGEPLERVQSDADRFTSAMLERGLIREDR